ncbi:uncharacterized protein LOC143242621 isoform X2 [Tachypleus tridentatus]|uniref:uncharacterized protein LOC143242621 isoform X2 n=1 Tax=Tachypleus tridentatus TaxID=6853 RepID=UPI003FD3FD07
MSYHDSFVRVFHSSSCLNYPCKTSRLVRRTNCLKPDFDIRGIHPVGNIGREQGSFWWPLLGAYLTHPLYFWDLNSVFSVFF